MLGRVHIIGSSWGGMLAIAYAIKHQRHVRSMTTVGGLHNIPMTTAEMQRMKEGLPSAVRNVMQRYEAEGGYDNPAYQEAVMVFYRKHLCRLPVWPRELVHSLEHISRPVYGTMNGPNEFTIIGNIRYWDVTDQLGRIRVPTLVVRANMTKSRPRWAGLSIEGCLARDWWCSKAAPTHRSGKAARNS